MHFLTLLYESVVLSDTFQSELFHQIDFVRIIQMFNLHKKN